MAPHVVQYHVPLYRALAEVPDIEIHTYYQSRAGLESYYIDDFACNVKWDVDLESGYDHSFLPNYGSSQFGGLFSRINPSIVSELKREKFDAVLIQGYSTLSDLATMFFARTHGLRIIFRGEGVLQGRTATNDTKEAVKKAFLRTWLKNCDSVLYSCKGNREYYQYYGADVRKLRFSPCCVDNEYFRKRYMELHPARNQIRDDLELEGGDFVVIMSSKLVALKRPYDLIDAISRLRNGNLVALVVGNGPAYGSLRDYARERGVRAKFTGFVNQVEMSHYYVAADCMAVVSEYDASPKSLNEAMNFALPVVVSDVIGTAGDLVRNEENGYIVGVGDIGALAEAIDTLAKDRCRADNMGKAAMEDVSKWSPYAAADAVKCAMLEDST